MRLYGGGGIGVTATIELALSRYVLALNSMRDLLAGHHAAHGGLYQAPGNSGTIADDKEVLIG